MDSYKENSEEEEEEMKGGERERGKNSKYWSRIFVLECMKVV